VAEQIAKQRGRPLRISGRDHDASDRAGTVRMPLPFRPPYEVGGLVLAEINATHRDLVRIEPGGAKLRIARPPFEGYGAGEGLYRQDRQSCRLRLAINRSRVAGLEHQTVEADRKARDLGADCAVVGKAEQLEVVRRKHREMVRGTQGVMTAGRQQEAERGKAAHRLVDAVARVDDDVIKDGRG
jgi:hypothetical protein